MDMFELTESGDKLFLKSLKIQRFKALKIKVCYIFETNYIQLKARYVVKILGLGFNFFGIRIKGQLTYSTYTAARDTENSLSFRIF
jgi:hypothetical protein